MDAIILMTRVPYRGHTKTRLMPYLSPTNCEGLHKSFLKDYFDCFDQLDENLDIFIAYAPEKNSKDFLASLPKQYNVFKQEGVNIGSRMYKCFQNIFSQGYQKVVLVGCDIPHIQKKTYKRAFEELETHDLVINPTEDGGYCLIGLNENYQALFINDVLWGEHSVIESTLHTAHELGLRVSVGKHYRDIDEFDDLIAFRDLFNQTDHNFDNVPICTLEFIDKLLEQEVV